MSRDCPNDVSFLCDKAAELRDTIKGTFFICKVTYAWCDMHRGLYAIYSFRRKRELYWCLSYSSKMKCLSLITESSRLTALCRILVRQVGSRIDGRGVCVCVCVCVINYFLPLMDSGRDVKSSLTCCRLYK